MEKQGWKTLAIILIIVIALWLAFGFWSIYEENKEYNREIECYYDFCGENVDAGYENKICACYDYDILGELIVVKTRIMD